jgi:hypothetical protein
VLALVDRSAPALAQCPYETVVAEDMTDR